MGGHVRAGDLDVWVEQVASGPGVPLIGGLGGTVEFWRFQLDGLRDRYRLTAFDNRGAGRTALPAGPLSVAAMADDAAAVLDAAGIPARRRRTERAGLARGLLPRPLHPAGARRRHGRRSHRRGAGVPAQAGPGGGQRTLDAVTADRSVDRLGRIAVPTLVPAGSLDLIARPELGRAVAAAIAGGRCEVLEGRSHQPFQEVPDRWNARVDAFWRQVAAAPAGFSPAAAGRAS